MDPFIGLPDEIITKICNQMTVPELINTAKASSKVYQVCSDIIKDRRKDYEYQQMENLINTDNVFLFRKDLNGSSSGITLYFHRGMLTITQQSDSNVFPWLIHEFGPNTGEKYQVLIIKDTPGLRKRISKALVDQGYKLKNLNPQKQQGYRSTD